MGDTFAGDTGVMLVGDTALAGRGGTEGLAVSGPGGEGAEGYAGLRSRLVGGGVVTGGEGLSCGAASWNLGGNGAAARPTGSGAGVISEGGLGMTIGVACEPSSAGGAWARRRQLSTREAKGMRWVSLPGSGGKGTHPGLHQIAISRRRRQSGSPRRTSFGVLVLIFFSRNGLLARLFCASEESLLRHSRLCGGCEFAD